MKITKQDFISKLSNHNSVFLGVSKKLYNADELKCILGDYIKTGPTLYEQRKVFKANNEKIVFNDKCVLSLNQIGKYYFNMFNIDGEVIVVCTFIWSDVCDGSTNEKSMYYGIV